MRLKKFTENNHSVLRNLSEVTRNREISTLLFVEECLESLGHPGADCDLAPLVGPTGRLTSDRKAILAHVKAEVEGGRLSERAKSLEISEIAARLNSALQERRIGRNSQLVTGIRDYERRAAEYAAHTQGALSNARNLRRQLQVLTDGAADIYPVVAASLVKLKEDGIPHELTSEGIDIITPPITLQWYGYDGYGDGHTRTLDNGRRYPAAVDGPVWSCDGAGHNTYKLGKYRLRFKITEQEFFFTLTPCKPDYWSYNGREWNNSRELYQHLNHPNVSDSGRLCEGEAAQDISNAMDAGDLYTIYHNVLSILCNYGWESPYRRLRHDYCERANELHAEQCGPIETIVIGDTDQDDEDCEDSF